MATLTKSIGTVTLAGAAEKVTLPAFYGWVWVKNMSDGNIFAGLSEDISEGADGVMTIPSGECGRINMDGSRVFYLLGTGNVQIVGQNYADCPFKASGKGGESPDLSAYALKSKYGDTTINVGRKAGTTVGAYSTAEGFDTTASGNYSHAEGIGTTASGSSPHAEGSSTTASGNSSHAEGYNTTASNNCSHAEGNNTTASGISSHAEGIGTTASGSSSHAEGYETIASGNYSHAGGVGTKALHNNEVAYGSYNKSNDDTLFSIGDGTSDTARHNAFEITATGGKLHDEAIMTQNKISNSNLLINPDFKINQRGISNLTTPGGTGSFVYTVDRWAIDDGGEVTVNSDGTLTVKGTISQKLENAVGDNVTASIGIVSGTATANYDNATKRFSITGDNAVISWAKLEYGGIATPFVAPDPATELVKCQRYYYCIQNQSTTAAQLLGMGYAQSTAELNAIIQFPTCMRTPPTVKAFNSSGDSVLYSKNGVSTASAVSAVTRNGCMKPFNAITIKCTGSFDASAMYQVYLEKSAYIEFDAEL